MTLGEHQEAFAADLTKLLSKAMSLGYSIRIGEVLRTEEMQKIYFQTGKSNTMNSMHLKKCAADLHFTKNGAICYPQELGDYWESLSPENQWGGNWKTFRDEPHFERHV